MKNTFLLIAILFTAALQHASAQSNLYEKYAVGTVLTHAKFERNTKFKTGLTTDAVIDSPVISVYGNNWFPIHYIPADNMKGYIITVNCKLDEGWLHDQEGSTRSDLAKTIVFEGYSPDNNVLNGIYLSALVTSQKDATTGKMKAISNLSIGVQTGTSFLPSTSIPDTVDNLFHDYQMAFADGHYYFYKDKKLLCVLEKNELDPGFKSDINYHNVFLENNVQKKRGEYLQATSVQVNELVVKTDRNPPLLKLFSPESKDDTLYVDEGHPIKLAGKCYSESGIESIAVNNSTVVPQGNGYFEYDTDQISDELRIAVASKTGGIFTKTYTIKKLKNISSTPRQFHPPIEKGHPPRFHALLFACSDYSKTHRDLLPKTITETRSLDRELEKDYQFDSKSVKIVIDAKFDDLKNEIQQTVKQMGEDDNLLIVFSGHGSFRPSQTKPVGYWIPVDGGIDEYHNWVSSDMLDTWLSDAKCKHILIICNTCFSGAFMGDTEPTFDENTSYSYQSVKAMSASGYQEIPSGCPFLHNITTVLKTNAGHPNQYYVSDDYLYGELRRMVSANASIYPKLRPFGTSGNNQNGNFFFILKGATMNFY